MNNIPTNQTKTRQSKEYYFEQGRLFEEYVRLLFNQDHFYLKKWRQSKLIPKDTFILDLAYPDLELIFAGKNHHPFAVECKWKTEFKKGKIGWAREYQIAKYLDFERKRAMPVFVAIGIGGTPSKPEKLFVTPLVNLKDYPIVCEDQLLEYKRKPTQRFFFDTVQLKLF